MIRNTEPVPLEPNETSNWLETVTDDEFFLLMSTKETIQEKMELLLEKVEEYRHRTIH